MSGENHGSGVGCCPKERRRQGGGVIWLMVLALLAILIVVGAVAFHVIAPGHWNRWAITQRRVPPTAIAPTVNDCLAVLKSAVPEKPALVERVSALLTESTEDPKTDGTSPAEMMVISYRERDGVVDDVVVQFYQPTRNGMIEILNPEGIVHARLGEELFGPAQNLMGLLYQPVVFLGEDEEIKRQRRAFRATIEGDLTLVREQTVEPLHVLTVMPRAEKFVPGSLRTRVDSVVVDTELTFAEWRSRIALLTGTPATAQQVGNTVAAWREMAVSLADTYAAYQTGQPLREALKTSDVQVAGSSVIASTAIPAKTVVKVTKEMAGYGVQKGCSQGFYKKSEHWPRGINEVRLGCVVYTRAEAINLLKTPSGGDASLILARQLIAAKLNLIYGLPAPTQVQQAVLDAEALLCSYSGHLPYNVSTSSPIGQQMVYLAGILDYYNNSCHTGGGDDMDNGGGGDGNGGGNNGGPKGNNGVGNGEDPQPPGNPPVNDGSGTGPGKPGKTKK